MVMTTFSLTLMMMTMMMMINLMMMMMTMMMMMMTKKMMMMMMMLMTVMVTTTTLPMTFLLSDALKRSTFRTVGSSADGHRRLKDAACQPPEHTSIWDVMSAPPREEHKPADGEKEVLE